MAMTPMGPDAQVVLVVEEGENANSILFNDGNGKVTDVAWQAPDCPDEVFEWLASSVATFHHISFATHKEPV